jgi:hypothetical protein
LIRVDEILFIVFRFQLSLCTMSLYKKLIIIIAKGTTTFIIKFLEIDVSIYVTFIMAALKCRLSCHVVDYTAIITFTN